MRSKAERIQKHERILARRLRQLRNVGSSVPHPHALLDDGVLGRCGHRRCMCHWIEKNRYQDHKYDEVADEAA